MDNADGFSLIELAIVLLIVGLLLGGLLGPISMRVDQGNIRATQDMLTDIQESLIGFAIANGYLPCPAISPTNGQEDRNGATGACNRRQGFLPWTTLGVPKLDAWGRIFYYSVTPAFSNSAKRIALNPLTAGDITIFTRSNLGALAPLSNQNDIPAVVLSFGKNGSGGTLDDGTPIGDLGATNLDEDANNNGTAALAPPGPVGRGFMSRNFTENTAIAGGEFDDIVVWISPYILFNRMVSAGRLQ